MANKSNEPERSVVTYIIPESIMISSIGSIMIGIEYSQELLAGHDKTYGRETRTARQTAERLESDILKMQATLAALSEIGGPLQDKLL